MYMYIYIYNIWPIIYSQAITYLKTTIYFKETIAMANSLQPVYFV